MKAVKEKIKDYSCTTSSRHNPIGIPKWQMEEFDRGDADYLATRRYYITESIKDEKLQSITKSNVEAEKAKREFDVLVKEWKEATAHFSSERQQVGHLSFLRIAVLGEKALPLILDEFRREPTSGWLSVLEAFAGKDVASDATTYREAIECWINWGKDKGYLKP